MNDKSNQATHQPAEQLTAEEILFTAVVGEIGEPLRPLIVKAMNEYAAQQTAALREELNIIKQERGAARSTMDEVRAELEAVQKEWDELKGKYNKACEERDEAVKLIKGAPAENRIHKSIPYHFWMKERAQFISRLSSGKTKHASPWISVEDRPLYIHEAEGWICTKEGMGEFIAAVPYVDSTKPGKDLWWIHHCVVEDEIGLCVVGEDGNNTAGWTLEDVAYYIPLPAPPESLNDKTE